MQDRLPGAGEGERGRDDLVARLKPDAVERGMDGGRPGVEHEAGRAPDERRPLDLGAVDLGSTDAAEDPAVQDRSHRGVVLRADVRPRSLQVVGDALAVAIEHGFAP